MSKFDSSGNYLWTRSWGGNEGDASYAVYANENGRIYVLGGFMASCDLAPDEAPCYEDPDVRTSIAGVDAFEIVFLPDGCC